MRRDPIHCEVCEVELTGDLDTFGAVGGERCFACYFDIYAHEPMSPQNIRLQIRQLMDFREDLLFDAQIYDEDADLILFDGNDDEEAELEVEELRERASNKRDEAEGIRVEIEWLQLQIGVARFWNEWWRETIARTEAERARRQSA